MEALDAIASMKDRSEKNDGERARELNMVRKQERVFLYIKVDCFASPYLRPGFDFLLSAEHSELVAGDVHVGQVAHRRLRHPSRE